MQRDVCDVSDSLVAPEEYGALEVPGFGCVLAGHREKSRVAWEDRTGGWIHIAKHSVHATDLVDGNGDEPVDDPYFRAGHHQALREIEERTLPPRIGGVSVLR